MLIVGKYYVRYLRCHEHVQAAADPGVGHSHCCDSYGPPYHSVQRPRPCPGKVVGGDTVVARFLQEVIVVNHARTCQYCHDYRLNCWKAYLSFRMSC